MLHQIKRVTVAANAAKMHLPVKDKILLKRKTAQYYILVYILHIRAPTATDFGGSVSDMCQAVLAG